MKLTDALVVALLHSLWIGALAQGLASVLVHLIDQRQARLRAAIVAAAVYFVAVAVAAMTIALSGHPPPDAASLFARTPAVTYDLLFALWCSGVALSGFRLGHDFAQLRALAATATPLKDPALRRVFKNLCRELGNATRVRLRITTDTLRPCVIGIFRPMVLLPVSCLSRLSLEELEAVVAHELAHVRRYDVLQTYLIAVIRAGLFFNPFVQGLGRHYAVECERACDDLAASWVAERRNLATALLKLGLRPHHNAFALSSSGRSGAVELQHRARRIVYTRSLSCKPRRREGSALAMATALLLALGAWMLAQGELTRASTLADRAQLIALKRAVCSVLEADRIYANPLYYAGGEAVLQVTDDAVRMQGRVLPKHTDRSLRRIFAQFGADKSDFMRLRYLGTRVHLTLNHRTAGGGLRQDVFTTSPRAEGAMDKVTAI